MSIHRRSLFAVAAASAAALAIPFAARAEGTLDEVKKRGVLRVGVIQAPPWYSKDPKTGQWASGLGIEMGKAMAQKLGVKFEPVEVTWGNAIAALQGDKIDLMFMLDARAERKQAANFPETPLLWYSLAVLARDDLDAKTWEDLNKQGVRIAVPQASTMDRWATQHTPKADIQPLMRVPCCCASHFRATAPAATMGAVRRAEERPPPRGSRRPYLRQ